MKLNRRQGFQVALAAGWACSSFARAEDEAPTTAPPPAATGDEVPRLAAFDRWMQAFLSEHRIPGGQLAATHAGRLVYSRGFGLADRDAKTPVQPHSLFRVASISKPITAVAILRLVAAGQLKLDDPIDDILKIEPHVEPDQSPDERWGKITVAHCLTHTGGWNRDASYDPMFAYGRVAKALGVKLPVGTSEIIRYMRGQPLDHPPGEKYAYSNFGYCLLGRVIEHLTGESYEAFTHKEVFAPLGITAPRIGGSLASQRAEDEVCYYTCDNGQQTPVVGPDAGQRDKAVPVQYGGWHQEALDAHGGWIASAADLVRFAAAFDDGALAKDRALLPPELATRMFAPQATIRPANTERKDAGVQYGLGWLLFTPAGSPRPVRCHGGALPCTASVLVKLPGDINLAALFNLGQSTPGVFLSRTLDQQMVALAQQVEPW